MSNDAMVFGRVQPQLGRVIVSFKVSCRFIVVTMPPLSVVWPPLPFLSCPALECQNAVNELSNLYSIE
jgi:hypothetical protein